MKKYKIIIVVGLLIWVFGPYLLYLIDTQLLHLPKYLFHFLNISVNSNTSINNTVKSQIANSENQYRVTITQAFVGIAVLYGVYQTWQRITIAEENLKVSQEGQITERFTRAIEQLGNTAIEIRLGGIYSLERIAKESQKDYWPIMEILIAYIRVNSYAHEETLKPCEIKEDIQAILTFIGKQEYSLNAKDFNLNLRNTRLCGAHLEEAYLKKAHLEEAHLEGAHLEEAYLKKAHLKKAHLKKAHLEEAHLPLAFIYKAHLEEANLRGANLEGAHLEGANLSKANLEGANLKEAKLNYYEETLSGMVIHEPTILKEAHLEGADFKFANLEEADFKFANLERADFQGANLKGANFKGAKNLKIDQLLKVKTLYKVKLDDKLLESFKKEHPNEYDTLNRNTDIRI
jgi:uncharacterized protein YjbI with pentapeptide repeats